VEQISQTPPDDLQQKLADLFSNNPDSRYHRDDSGGVVTRPWGDESFEFQVKDGDQKLIDALNAIYLPPELTALWHRDTEELKIIYAPLVNTSDECSRSFSFTFKNRPHNCEFSRASDRLLALVSAMRAKEEPSIMNFRNLRDFIIHQRRSARDPEFAG
jgi:hypothetical protein